MTTIMSSSFDFDRGPIMSILISSSISGLSFENSDISINNNINLGLYFDIPNFSSICMVYAL